MPREEEHNDSYGKRENHCDRKIRIARNRVYATGNKWLIQDFNERYGR